MMKSATVDLAVIVENQIVLIRRAKPPFEDRWVLPGGHVESGESNLEAAVRELEEEVGLALSPERLTPLCILDAPNRDPRGPKISTVFAARISREEWKLAKAGSDAKAIALHCLEDLKPEEIGFDHSAVIEILRRRHESA